VVVTELSSPSSITIRSERFWNIEKVLRLLHMWFDAPESMTNSGAGAAARAQGVSQTGSHSPVVVRAAGAVALSAFHHSFIRL
jgi:hypothetical protein